jgi:phospholipid/cholesterol/gamma-HCH transport system ATP-binding protein
VTTDLSKALVVRDLQMNYDRTIIMENLTFEVSRESIFVIMGKSGCGKSTLLKYLIGLKKPEKGSIYYGKDDFAHASLEVQSKLLRRFGVLYQNGALWSTLTLAENVSLPLELYTSLSKNDIYELASLKLGLVGLAGFENYYPYELSGGMRKRAGLARALALDPEILFFDEPSAGLDPVTARKLDDLILQIRNSLGTTIIVITHDLSSIFKIADDCIFLDSTSKCIVAHGNPHSLLNRSAHPSVREFLEPLPLHFEIT